MELSRGPTGPEANGRNSERSRSRWGVGTRRGWPTLSSAKQRGRSTGTKSPDASTIRTGGRFKNAAVPRFDGDGCCQQHLQILYAIAKSNGWTDETVALQLFAHLEGEALNVALLMLEGEHANREGLSQGLSNYYNSPGRLAVFRRKFGSVTRRTGVAVRGFRDMGTCARNWMVRDRFIAYQRSCGLRRHLDSVPPDTPIREIVDHCRVWESPLEQKRGSAPGTGLDRELSGMSGDSRESRLFRPDSLRTFGCPELDSRIPVSVASVVQSDIGAPRGAGAGCSQDAPLEIMSSLIARLLRAAQEDNPAEMKVPPDAGA